jgi:methionine synthase II (cobalamin-independent)
VSGAIDFVEDHDADRFSSDLGFHILKETRERTIKAISDAVDADIRKQVDQVIKETISEFVDAGLITVSGKEVTIREHMYSVFRSNHGWSNASDKMAQLAKTFGDDLKKQYNAIFATKIVMNMREQGFLREDMAQILLEGSKSS